MHTFDKINDLADELDLSSFEVGCVTVSDGGKRMLIKFYKRDRSYARLFHYNSDCTDVADPAKLDAFLSRVRTWAEKLNMTEGAKRHD